jgi:hypothetical protein
MVWGIVLKFYAILSLFCYISDTNPSQENWQVSPLPICTNWPQAKSFVRYWVKKNAGCISHWIPYSASKTNSVQSVHFSVWLDTQHASSTFFKGFKCKNLRVRYPGRSGDVPAHSYTFDMTYPQHECMVSWINELRNTSTAILPNSPFMDHIRSELMQSLTSSVEMSLL